MPLAGLWSWVTGQTKASPKPHLSDLGPGPGLWRACEHLWEGRLFPRGTARSRTSHKGPTSVRLTICRGSRVGQVLCGTASETASGCSDMEYHLAVVKDPELEREIERPARYNPTHLHKAKALGPYHLRRAGLSISLTFPALSGGRLVLAGVSPHSSIAVSWSLHL